MRLNAFLARSGIASRRQAELIIAQGRITLNGEVIKDPAKSVSEQDSVCFDQNPVQLIEKTRVWCYHKPRGLLTTHHDPQGRPTVFDDVKDRLPRVLSVGRLDFNSEGLLLLTNDSNFAHKAEKSKWPRCYRVRILGQPNLDDFEKMKKGITLDGVWYAPIKIDYELKDSANQWVFITLFEGKNREIRKLMESVGCQVNRLIRVSYGPFQLNDLNPGDITEIKGKLLEEVGNIKI